MWCTCYEDGIHPHLGQHRGFTLKLVVAVARLFIERILVLWLMSVVLFDGSLRHFKGSLPTRLRTVKFSKQQDVCKCAINSISGSAAFTRDQLQNTIKFVGMTNSLKNFVVVDLRNEPHGFINGELPISLFSLPFNWAKAEFARGKMPALPRLSTIREHDGAIVRSHVFNVERVVDERTFVENLGATYVRLPTKDHRVPEDYVTEAFVKLYQQAPTRSNTGLHLHFHCRAGRGRTSLFMIMLHMMHMASCCPSVGPAGALEKLSALHVGLGSKDILANPPSTLEPIRRSLSIARTRFLRDFSMFAFFWVSNMD